MNKSDYISRMEVIIGDKTKFHEIGPVSLCDRTAQHERSLQVCLLRMRKSEKV